jgi:hypothetical protein
MRAATKKPAFSAGFLFSGTVIHGKREAPPYVIPEFAEGKYPGSYRSKCAIPWHRSGAREIPDNRLRRFPE